MNGQDWHQLRNVVEAARAELDLPHGPTPHTQQWMPEDSRRRRDAVIRAAFLLAALAAAVAAIVIGTR